MKKIRVHPSRWFQDSHWPGIGESDMSDSEAKAEDERKQASPSLPGEAHGSLVANVVRRVSPNTYVVQFKDKPGFTTIQCYVQHVHEDEVDNLYNSDVFRWNHGHNPTVLVGLGPFCLKRGLFLNCRLACPPSFEGPSVTVHQVKQQRRYWGSLPSGGS